VDINREIRGRLEAVYEEIMWLACRKGVTPSMARAWYTHIVTNRLKLRRFTGEVSDKAVADPNAVLRLEHHGRIQNALTQLVSRHLKLKQSLPHEFVETVLKAESVHIVTFGENYDAMRSRGDYDSAGIVLTNWGSISLDKRTILWHKMLRGKVANADEFR
jgi:hypothetical protein